MKTETNNEFDKHRAVSIKKQKESKCKCKPEWQAWDRFEGYWYCTKCLNPI